MEKKINDELKKDNLLGSFLLAHSYIDAFMRDWLFYCGEGEQSNLPENTLEDIDRITFFDLLHIHLAMGNTGFVLYKRLRNFNKIRNEVSHNISSIDLYSNKTRLELTKQIKEGIMLCNEVFDSYKKAIKKKSKEIN